MKKKIILSLVVLLLLSTLFNSQLRAEDGFIMSIKDVVGPKMEGEKGRVPLVTYISEGGVMAGEFWYNSDLFDNDTKMTAVLLASPSTGIVTSYNRISNYPLGEDWKLGGNVKIIKYNDIKSGSIGNDSADKEIPEEYFAALEDYKKLKASGEVMDADPTGNTVNKPVSDLIYGIATDRITGGQAEYIRKNLTSEEKEILETLEDDETREKLDGYRVYEGWNNKVALDLTYEINEYNEIVTEYAYEELTSQASDYKSDTLSLAWENQRVDDQTNPSQGHKIIARVKKSLELIAGNGGKDWDYTKYTLDLRKYIPLFKSSTLGLRMRTQSTTGDEIVDEERTALERFRTGDPNIEVTTYAPFFDMSLLGDLNTMRGYRYYRFYDNNSVLYQSELRFPMENLLSGLQGTVFAEAGRVSEHFDSDLFLQDMHYTGGVGVKYFFNEDILARIDLGFSEEGTQVRMNIGQTF